MIEERFESDLRAALRSHAPSSAPASLRAAPARIVREHRPSAVAGLLPPRWASLPADRSPVFAIAAVVLVLAALVGTQVYWRLGTSGTGASPNNPVKWSSGLVSLTASDFWIVAGGGRYVAPGSVVIHSDPGTAVYRTLELSWQERGHEMRLNIYIAADRQNWWASEIRTYNGQEPSDWIIYPGPQFTSPRGQAYHGNLDLAATTRGIAGSIHFRELVLDAMPRLEDGPASWTANCRRAPVVGGEPPSDPLAAGEPLAGTGIIGMNAETASKLIESVGLCVSWRFEYRTGDRTGYSELWCTPPPGNVTWVSYGSTGEVIVAVGTPGDPIRQDRPQPPNGWGC